MPTPRSSQSSETRPRELRPMIRLLLTNLTLTAILGILLLIMRERVLDLQMTAAHVTPATEATVRASLNSSLWIRIGTVAVIGVVYVFLIRRLRDGHRRSWFRVLTLSVVSLAAMVFNAVYSTYPAWFFVEQAVQAVVLVALFWTATRPAVRAYFAKRPTPVTV